MLSVLYLKTLRCNMFILGRNIGQGYRCAMSWCDFDLIFDFAVLILTFKMLLGYISKTVRCRKLVLHGTLVEECRCAMSWCDLDLIFDLAVLSLIFKILSRLYLGNCKKLIIGRYIGWRV